MSGTALASTRCRCGPLLTKNRRSFRQYRSSTRWRCRRVTGTVREMRRSYWYTRERWMLVFPGKRSLSKAPRAVCRTTRDAPPVQGTPGQRYAHWGSSSTFPGLTPGLSHLRLPVRPDNADKKRLATKKLSAGRLEFRKFAAFLPDTLHWGTIPKIPATALEFLKCDSPGVGHGVSYPGIATTR